MMVLAYIRPEFAKPALESLQELPTPLRPIRFSSTDAWAPKKNMISDRERYNKFVKQNGFGFSLFAERCLYDYARTIVIGYSEVDAYPLKIGLTDGDLVTIFDLLGKAGADFWFAAETEEYHHRNRYVVRIKESDIKSWCGASCIESWVGRDLNRYLPGLYWMTGISAQLADRFGISCEDIPPGAVARVELSGALTIRMTGRADEWRNWATQVDTYCAARDSFFSLQRIRAELEAAKTDQELSTVLDRWP